ncbi:TIGR00266 family protein [Paludisphaera rhizosphaerae]|uniref:TIGR00266 family protein n=1 Tax=Paludisphaera rhizosphaerae TaxID=2711216 RepID=UPI0013ECD057|nr:TIGR00266 family protein [Paludisphaera rhizosphaerae]
MEFEVVGNTDYGRLEVTLAPGESILAEAGAMSWMASGLQMQSRLIGGLLQAAIRRVVGGESLFVGEYSAYGERGAVAFAPSEPGSVLHRRLKGDSFILTAGSFLACTPGVQLQTRFGGLKAFFSGEGAFFLECSGMGDLFFNAYGGVIERQVDGALVVDTGHLVAWEPSLSYTVGGMGGLKQTFFSGEGLVLRLEGRGKVFLQTRTVPSLAGWIMPFLPS